MGAMKPDQAYNKNVNFKLRALEISQYQGQTTLSPVINVTTLDFTFGLSEKTSIQLKVPYQWVEGDLGSTSGLADISLSASTNLYSSDKFDINATLGTKIPTGNSNIDTERGFDYPMYYQVSLGSTDLIAGVSLISKGWLIAAGYQQAFGTNGNQFRFEQWAGFENQEYLLMHDLSENLRRGTDVMLRVERNFRFSRINFNVGLLPIWRITRDEILNPSSNERVKLPGTTGLALSGLMGVGYQFNVHNGVKFIYGVKISQRSVNPDELTRDSVLSIAYVVRF